MQNEYINTKKTLGKKKWPDENRQHLVPKRHSANLCWVKAWGHEAIRAGPRSRVLEKRGARGLIQWWGNTEQLAEAGSEARTRCVAHDESAGKQQETKLAREQGESVKGLKGKATKTSDRSSQLRGGLRVNDHLKKHKKLVMKPIPPNRPNRGRKSWNIFQRLLSNSVNTALICLLSDS